MVVLAIAFSLTGNDSPPVSPGERKVAEPAESKVALVAQNDSGESGVAIIRDEGGKAKVILNLRNTPAIPQPAHIHLGACPTPAAVKYPLANVVNGVSETLLAVSANELLKQLPLAINVHKSSDDLKTYVACGNINK
mgnify:CR=1 FL=1